MTDRIDPRALRFKAERIDPMALRASDSVMRRAHTLPSGETAIPGIATLHDAIAEVYGDTISALEQAREALATRCHDCVAGCEFAPNGKHVISREYSGTYRECALSTEDRAALVAIDALRE